MPTSIHHSIDYLSQFVNCVRQVNIVEVRIARRGLDGCVPEQFADHRQRLRCHRCVARKRVPEIVQTNVGHSRLNPDTVPGI